MGLEAGKVMSKTNIDRTTEQATPARRSADVNVALGLRVAQLQVLGRALAHVAHDVQNHIAIISESAGLMGDLLKLKNKQRFGRIRRFFKRDQGQRVDIEPFLRGLNTIQQQVALGSTLNQRLGSFAHRLEETHSVFYGNKVLEEIQDALLRQAREKGIRLEIKLAGEAPMIETDPPRFQLAVFGNVEQVMEGLESGDWLALEAGVREGRFEVRLTSPCGEQSGGLLRDEPDGQDFSRDIVEDLGGQVWKQSGDGTYVTTLAFPLASRET